MFFREKKMNDVSTEIMRYLFAGYNNDKIFLLIGWDDPQVIKEDKLREEISGEKIAHNKDASNKLRNLIRVNRSKFNELQLREERFKMIESGLMTPFDEIEASNTHRINTGIKEINEVFGSSLISDEDGNVISEEHGIPRGKIILVGGEQGVGKTRFYTALSHKLVSDYGFKVGVAQAEMSLSEYKSLAIQVMGTSQSHLRNQHNFFIGGDKMRNIKDQIKAIKEYHPDLWIIDSYQMIREGNTKSGIEDMIFYLKKAIGDHTAVLLITHLNAKGVIKGDNTLQYLSDVCVIMKKENPDNGLFSLSIPGKNRAGKTGGKAYLQHKGGQVHVVPHSLAEELVEV